MVKVAFVMEKNMLPVPNVKGGAVETLMTILLEQNEIEGKCEFLFIIPYDEDEVVKYVHSKIYRCSDDITTIGLYKFNPDFEWDFEYVYDCKAAFVVQTEKPDFVIMEGALRITGCFEYVIDRNRLALHLHACNYDTKFYRDTFNFVIVPSDFVAENWRRKLQRNDVRTYILKNSINDKYFQKELNAEDRKRGRNILGISEKDFLVIFCGRLIYEKGIKELMEAILCMESSQNVKLLVVGTDSFANGNRFAYAKIIEGIIDKNHDRMIYAGYIPNERIADYYKLADVQVVPSVCEESAGLVAIEGMYCGLPVIVTDSGGMVEYVNKDTGIIINKSNGLVKNIMDAILWVKNNKKEADARAERAYFEALKYTRETYYDNFCGILNLWSEDSKDGSF